MIFPFAGSAGPLSRDSKWDIAVRNRNLLCEWQTLESRWVEELRHTFAEKPEADDKHFHENNSDANNDRNGDK